jgi:hypothetical protein
MIFARLRLWLRRHKNVADFDGTDWALLETVTRKIERQHPDDCRRIRAEADAEFERIKSLTMFQSRTLN